MHYQHESLETSLGLLREVSGRMLTSAEHGEWQMVSELERRREQLLKECLAADTIDQTANGMIADTLRTLLAENDQLVVLASASRQEAVEALTGARNRRTASSAYRAVAN